MHVKNITRYDLLFVLLLVLTFSVALTSGSSSFDNADIVLRLEMLFVAAYLLILRSVTEFVKLFKKHPIVTLLLALWFVSVTISFFSSPYHVAENYLGVARYSQTMFHLVFFLFVYQFLSQVSSKKHYAVMLTIPLSTVVLAVVFINAGFYIDQSVNTNWTHNPPLNSNIRHTGYILTAAASITVVLALYPTVTFRQTAQYLSLLLISSAFLFWTGGRAAMVSLIGIFLLIIRYLIFHRKLDKYRLFLTCLTIAIAIFLSEMLKIFDWNGLLYAIFRTGESGDLQALTSSRTLVWGSVLESMKGHWLFGLGPQGYYLMPNRIYGVQPHNMFLQFLVEWGAVGGTVFLTMLIWGSIRIVSMLKDKKKFASVAYLSAATVIASLTIHGLVDGTYYHGQPSYYIVLAFAVCLSAIANESKNK